MRLTLRTLLAYLDDTLDPSEIKHIGQKVAESDAAQELIARIKQITRRRRLTTPPLTGPGAKFDANAVAEYLDNELAADQVSELEKICLESDVHLAEIASCHQILTLVLGEPALVPPTAKERMYQLVEGREAIPSRKAPAPFTASPTNSRHDLEPDESPLLGLPFFRKAGWIRWVLPAAALLLVGALGIAIWMALPEKRDQGTPGPQARRNDKEADKDKDKDDSTKKVEPTPKPPDTTPKPPDTTPKPPDTTPKPPDTTPKPPDTTPKPPEVDPVPPRVGQRPAPPRTDRVLVGNYQQADRRESVLVQRPRQGDLTFKRLKPGASIYSNETLLNLPGYTTQLETKSGVGITMRGSLPEFAIGPVMNNLLDVEMVLHAPPDGTDLDVTLDRGRIYFANLKENKDAVVRLRFLEQVWDLTLKPGTEVGVDMIRTYGGEMNYLKEEPWTSVSLFVDQGNADLTINTYHKRKMAAPPGPAVLQWDSNTEVPPNPVSMAENHPGWSKLSPARVLENYRNKMIDFAKKSKPEVAARLKYEIDFVAGQINRTTASLNGLDAYSGQLNMGKSLDVAIVEALASPEPEQRHVTIFVMGSVGFLDKLLATLGDEDPQRGAERDDAIFVLRRYLSRGLEASRVLFNDDGKTKTGLLVDKYGEKDGETVFTLLHDLNPKYLTSDLFGYLTASLRNKKLAVRQLAIWHLMRQSLGVKMMPPAALMYDPADPDRERRENAAFAWQKLVDEKKLPVMP
jgi:hypothetical protein